MDAQMLRNPTFADYPFAAGGQSPDGYLKALTDAQEIARELRREARRLGFPAEELDRLVEARADGLAAFWTRAGDAKSVRVSPDTGPYGGRAQRVETTAADQGIAQWTYLPLHRARTYEFEIFARSPDVKGLAVSLGQGDQEVVAKIEGLSTEWKALRGTLALPDSGTADSPWRFELTLNAPGQLVVKRVFLRPGDHVNGFDPDVVRFLRESRLPILRWPGGNFVSGYHWEDGVGPIDQRPTLPNPAWGNVETNHFGTDEFMAFCRAVGCEPMICINAGNGTPDEAARWVEYCNGPATSPMGRLRAANGRREPYGVRVWEVGNELWGRWQVHWTTPRGYVDRYRAFIEAMRKADPSIELYACGAPVLSGKEWNDTLIAGAAPILETITDHPLIGGQVPADTDPLDVYRDYMAVPDVLERKWGEIQRQMAAAGIREPRLAVTELQIFARIGRREDGRPARLTSMTLVSPRTLAEGLHDVLLYHAAVRLAPFIPLFTHSATVNHGGGLRKERERVYANPCHYAQTMFREFAGAAPVAIQIEAPTERARIVVPQIREATKEERYRIIDALAALAPDGDLLLSIVHRGTENPVRLAIALTGFEAAPEARTQRLSADVPWAANSLDAPEAVKPVEGQARVEHNRLVLDIPPYTYMTIRLMKK
jgi:alpha-N-arabinofuranosidase